MNTTKREMALNEGIHVIPISNSASKCLMENWVEERAAKPLDEDLPSLHKQKRGHKGIITLAEKEKIEASRTTDIMRHQQTTKNSL